MIESPQAVVVLSPFRATERRTRAEHGAMAQLLCRKLARAGCIVYAGHLMAPSFLDEDLPSDRECGIRINLGWIERSDRIAVWDTWGISTGMAQEIAFAEEINRKWHGDRLNLTPHRANSDWLEKNTPRARPILINYFSKGEVPEWAELHSLR